MKMGKALAASAVSGILMGVLAGCGGDKPPVAAPTTDNATGGAKGSCGGKGSCHGTAAPAGSGEQKGSCSGKGSCSAQSGTTPPKTN